MSLEGRADKERHATYVVLTSIFFGIFAIANRLIGQKRKDLRPMDLTLLGLSTFRLGRLIAFDKVTETYRLPFTQTVPDPTGAGDTVEPRGTGWRQAVGELISCPICSGTWVAAALVYALQIVPGPTRVFLGIMSAIGLGELLHAATELMSWRAQVAREQSGSYAIARAREG